MSFNRDPGINESLGIEGVQRGSELAELIVFSNYDNDVLGTFAGMDKTIQYGNGKFPSAEQYYATVESLLDESAGLSHKRLAALAQRDWHMRGQNGCQFARLVAADADNIGWTYSVVDESMDSINVETAQRLDEVMVGVENDQTIEVNSLLFPGIKDVKSALTTINALTETNRFWLERNEIVDGLLRLSLRYPVDDGNAQAWIMAFGPFSFLPNTRRAPYFELAIRVKPKPPKIFHRLNQDGSAAHLADVPLQMSDANWENRFNSTLRRTRHILGGEPNDVSAAKATLAVPIELLD